MIPITLIFEIKIKSCDQSSKVTRTYRHDLAGLDADHRAVSPCLRYAISGQGLEPVAGQLVA